MKRVCPRGHIRTTYRCLMCARLREQRRPSREQRGYGAAHRKRAREAIDAEPWCHTLPACPYSDAGTPDNPLTADHVIPVKRGGLHGPLTVLCLRCNSGKRDRPAGVASGANA